MVVGDEIVGWGFSIFPHLKLLDAIFTALLFSPQNRAIIAPARAEYSAGA